MKQTWLVHKLLRIGYVIVWRLGALARPWRKTSLTANSRD